MAVGDVDRRQGIEGAAELADGRVVGDHPELVAHAVVGGDVDLRRAGGRLRQQRVDRRRVRVADHHRAGLRVDRLDLADAVVFLHRRRQLVLADAVGGVVGERGGGGEAGLRAAAPSEPVDVIAGLGVARQDAVGDHLCEILGRLGVDRAIVGVGRGVEVDLRLRDMQKAPRLARGARARLRAREHVIGRRQYLGGASGRGAQGAEGFNERQDGLRGVG